MLRFSCTLTPATRGRRAGATRLTIVIPGAALVAALGAVVGRTTNAHGAPHVDAPPDSAHTAVPRCDAHNDPVDTASAEGGPTRGVRDSTYVGRRGFDGSHGLRR